MSGNEQSVVKGAGFLLEPIGTRDIFIPEEQNEDERNLAKLASDFSINEVLPKSDEIEAKKEGVIPGLLKKAGELGLLMAEVSEKYGGLQLGKVPTTFISENLTHQGSFTVAFMCHTGIAMLPLRAFGTDAQKQKYLTKLATGEWLGAYALTEPGAGSDALAHRTSATLSKDGKHYILNGEKVFITNGGFADLFTLFAKIDGEKFTAFLVERNFEGVSTGPEEKKMGIHGSSTTPLVLKDAKIPVENVLGEIGKGHRIAFNVLNLGRWKLGAACLGSCKRLIEKMIPYVKERQQFGKPIAEFALIRDKIATSALVTYMLESLVYRFADMIDKSIGTLDRSSADFDTKRESFLKEYAVEASIAKIYGSEALQIVADEAVQAFGGYGYIAEYDVERFYRDSRINRIFEGTNEINRLIVANTVLKRAMSQELPFMQKLQEILGQLKSGFPPAQDYGELTHEVEAVEQMKRLAVYVAGVAVQQYADQLENKQRVLALIADLISESYALESGVIRALKIVRLSGNEKASIAIAMCKVGIAEQMHQLSNRARQALMNMAGETKEFEKYAKALDRIAPTLFVNTEELREKIALHMLSKNGYEI
ncbi:MAG: hypothetical protein A3C46_00725 [Deltaproteobacteria bacterium RIFCSPHIGHO2_02_FULL_44_16]|nr:MAG: hypothetical protein A3C46_00725 [Deltaproteobacteria bacterium RIFCSPHIGHO2_02_FULL_44_16]